MTASLLSAGKWSTTTLRIPKYTHTFTSSDVSALNSRPKRTTDFASNGVTTAIADTSYVFGSNIGYVTTSCSLGYWPPGPSCPTASTVTDSWRLNPAPETTSGGCYTKNLGVIGRFVNGVSIYGTSDGVTYNNARVWYNSAPEFEVYDMDICNGHAANGDYHHHHYPKCLQERLSDTGDSHSPLYGFMADSYPIYGPYQSAGVLATPCWQTRNYAASSVTGCSTGTRSCQLRDQYDYTQGTISVTAGPSLTGTLSTQSGNTIPGASGAYFEDYFFNSTCSSHGNQYLDSRNGHSHGSLGYHYHVTINSSGKALFPYLAGPKYYGCLGSNTCCTSRTSSTCTGTSTCKSPADGLTTFACST